MNNLNLEITGDITYTGDIEIIDSIVAVAGTLIIGGVSSDFNFSDDLVDVTTETNYSLADQRDVSVSISTDVLDEIDCGTELVSGTMVTGDTSLTLMTGVYKYKIDTAHTTTHGQLFSFDSITETIVDNDLNIIDTSVSGEFARKLPEKDISSASGHNTVNLLAGDSPMSTVDASGNTHPWGKPEVVDIYKPLTYGYSVNAFIVGGDFSGKYLTDEDAINPPDPDPEPVETLQFVNIINVVTLPERTPIQFEDFTMATDLDSIAWVFNFNVKDQASVALLKPSGLTVKHVEVNINGTTYECFIGRTSTSVGVDGSTRKTVRVTKCTGWSNVKKLSYPYSSKRSRTESSSSTPAGILNSELTGTGFTGSWNAPSWAIPANIHSYSDKAPIAAISELAQSVGATIAPDDMGDGFSIEPRYPVSPWNWDGETPDVIMNEINFFTIDTEWIPAESPDSIFVYGEANGVGVKCVKNGTGGTVTLPTVVNKYITDTIAGIERGRIEVAANGFKEVIPVTTFVGVEGVLKPRTLVEVNAIEGGSWRGMITSVSISLKRNGNALVQSLQIERHYNE